MYSESELKKILTNSKYKFFPNLIKTKFIWSTCYNPPAKPSRRDKTYPGKFCGICFIQLMNKNKMMRKINQTDLKKNDQVTKLSGEFHAILEKCYGSTWSGEKKQKSHAAMHRDKQDYRHFSIYDISPYMFKKVDNLIEFFIRYHIGQSEKIGNIKFLNPQSPERLDEILEKINETTEKQKNETSNFFRHNVQTKPSTSKQQRLSFSSQPSRKRSAAVLGDNRVAKRQQTNANNNNINANIQVSSPTVPTAPVNSENNNRNTPNQPRNLPGVINVKIDHSPAIKAQIMEFEHQTSRFLYNYSL